MDFYKIVNKEDMNASKVWIIRSGHDAEYYSHFRQNSLIAIDHAKLANSDEISSGTLNDKSKLAVLQSVEKKLKDLGKTSKQQIGSKVGQVRRFLFEVSVGDMILTLSPAGSVLTGIISSEAQVSRIPIGISSSDDKDRLNVCEFFLRREVNWGKSRSRDSLPYIVDRTFRNTSTIFKIQKDDAVKALNHWLYPLHCVDGEIRCSLDIRTQNRIGNRDFTSLSSKLDELEAASEYLYSKFTDKSFDIENWNVDADELQGFIKSYQCFNLKTQQTAMSPGHQFVQLEAERLKQVIFASLFVLCFSTNSLAEEELSKNEIAFVKKSVEIAKILDHDSNIAGTAERMNLRVPKSIVDKSDQPLRKFPPVSKTGKKGK